MFTNAWVCISRLRQLGCTLPIQLWYCGECELDERMRALLASRAVECVNVEQVTRAHPANLAHIWAIKPYAILYSRFQQVLLLDADNVPVRDPEYLFETLQFRRRGAVFWPDYWPLKRESTAWNLFDVPFRKGPEFETGQVLVNKAVCWRPLNLSLWYNQHHELFYQHVYGDKQTFQMAFLKLKSAYAMPHRKPHRLPGVMCQHDFQGRRLFQHRTQAKWRLFGPNRLIRGFRFDRECRKCLRELRKVWDGQIEKLQPRPLPAGEDIGPANTAIHLLTCMLSLPERATALQNTLANLARTDWADRFVHVVIDEQRFTRPEERLAHTAWRALRMALRSSTDYILLLQDDLVFADRFFQNLCSWPVLSQRQLTLATLFNADLRELARFPTSDAIAIDPRTLRGSEALLISRPAAQLFVDHWQQRPDLPGAKMGLLATRLQYPVFCHAPSLVRRVRPRSAPGKEFLQACDFKADWLAPGRCSNEVSVVSCPSDTPDHG